MSGILIGLTGCNLPSSSVNIPTATMEAMLPSDVPSNPTEPPTPTPEKTTVIFIPGSSPADGLDLLLSNALSGLSTDTYETETLPSLSVDSVPENADVILFRNPPADIETYTTKYPEKAFVSLSSEQLPGNTWTIQYDHGYLPFLAGLATVIESYDWRSGALFVSDSTIYGPDFEETYTNGAQFFCGNCLSNLAPYINFPVILTNPTGTTDDIWNSAISDAAANVIYTWFVDGEAVSSGVWQKLSETDTQFIGLSSPPAGLEDRWLATLNYDWTGTLESMLSLIDGDGQSGRMIPAELSIISGAFPNRFQEGRIDYLTKVYNDLLSGLISPYDPETSYDG